MIDDNLFAKFDSIEDLPISEEILGAYIEGNLNEGEILEIAPVISQDVMLSNLMNSIEETQSGLNNFEDFIDGQIDFPDNDFFTNSTYETEEETETMNGTFYNIYGEAGENVKDPVYIQQPDDHSCALRSQQIVLRDFGIDIPFEKLEELALSNGVYSDQGTYTYDIGKVLQIAGVDMHQVQGSTFLDLTNELAQGHRVIVSVDANELWYTDPVSKLKNWFNDVIGNQGGNHALIVAGVEVNPQNPNDVKVVLTDPGAGHLRVEYPLDQFMDAWKDSKCFMAATDYPAPYQYDPETGMEVPSNFMVQQFVNDFISSNSYQLNPDLINIPADYQPAYVDHLNMVGTLDYESFEKNYLDFKDSQFPSTLSIKEQIEEQAERNAISEVSGDDLYLHRNDDLDDSSIGEDNTVQFNSSITSENQANSGDTSIVEDIEYNNLRGDDFTHDDDDSDDKSANSEQYHNEHSEDDSDDDSDDDCEE